MLPTWNSRQGLLNEHGCDSFDSYYVSNERQWVSYLVYDTSCVKANDLIPLVPLADGDPCQGICIALLAGHYVLPPTVFVQFPAMHDAMTGWPLMTYAVQAVILSFLPEGCQWTFSTQDTSAEGFPQSLLAVDTTVADHIWPSVWHSRQELTDNSESQPLTYLQLSLGWFNLLQPVWFPHPQALLFGGVLSIYFT